MMDIPKQLLHYVTELALELNCQQAEKIYSLLENYQQNDWEYLDLVLRKQLPASCQITIGKLLRVWEEDHPEITAQSVGLTLLSLSYLNEKNRKEQDVQLVWTGPDSRIIPLRRTDQVLMDLINQSQQNLWIVSFAIYRIDKIMMVLKQAIQRGVHVHIILETKEESEGKLTFDILKRLKAELGNQPCFYTWPFEKRSLSEKGIPGTLHAKVAVADGKMALISSANLTEFALNLNMEMGVLLKGNDIPLKVERHFEALIAMGVVREV
jgi:phosphatidylserine/phosphatidylglycerophosphate/cardiolipin synthase-like enzyme